MNATPPETLSFRLTADGQPLGDAVGAWLVEAPAFVRLCSLASRLRQPMTRVVVAGAPTHDVTYDVTVRPDRTGIDVSAARLAMRAIDQLRAPRSLLANPLLLDGDVPTIRFRCDARLRLLDVFDHAGRQGLGPRHWDGRSLASLFILEPDQNGLFPLLTALAEGSSFLGQRARLRIDDADRIGPTVILSGCPDFMDGALTGFRGQADVAQAPSAAPARDAADIGANVREPVPSPGFARMVDTALRAPLGRIIAGADSMATASEGPIRDDYARYATDISGAARHLLTLVDDLVVLSIIDRDSFTAASERVSLHDIAQKAAKLLAIQAANHGVVIDLAATDGGADGVQADVVAEQRRTLQILLNLLGNAIRYGARPGRVTIRFASDPAFASVSVSDDGPGIAPSLRDRLFARFERLGRTDAGGSGLGLYISRRLARVMGGDLVFDQGSDGGAAFTLSLPRWPLAADAADQRRSTGT